MVKPNTDINLAIENNSIKNITNQNITAKILFSIGIGILSPIICPTFGKIVIIVVNNLSNRKIVDTILSNKLYKSTIHWIT